MTTSFHSTKSEWTGPTSKIWRDNQCPNLQNLANHHTVGSCKQACRKKEGCTAFNYNKKVGCALRACPSSVLHVPSWKLEGWEGYFFDKSKKICLLN